MRLLEGLLFLSLATSAHLGVWSLAPATTGSTSAGGAGAASVTTLAATPAEANLVARWDKAPAVEDVSASLAPVTPTALDTPALPGRAAPIAPQMALKLARLEPAPDLPQVDTSPAPPPRAAATPPPDQRPKARPEPRTPPQKPQAAAPARQASGQAQEKIRGTGGAARTQSNDAARTNALRAQWGAAIYAKVQRNLNPPRGSAAEGTAKLALRVASNGSLQGLSLTRSSGSADLDRAALAAIKRAGRFASAPEGLDGESHDFSLSLTFTR